MDWKLVKPSDIKSIHMRFEGDVNSYWDVKLKDGTGGKFYGCESGPHYEENDYSLWDDNQELYDFLCELQQVHVPGNRSDDDGVDFDLVFTHPNRAIMSNIVVQKHDDGTWDKYEKVKGSFVVKL